MARDEILVSFYFTLVWVALVYDMSARRGIRSWYWILIAILLGPLTIPPLLFIPVRPDLATKGIWGP